MAKEENDNGQGSLPPPEFTNRPKELENDTNPSWTWTPTGETYDFQLSKNKDFSQPMVDLTDVLDLSYQHSPGFSDDGSSDGLYYYRVRSKTDPEVSSWSKGTFELHTNRLPEPEFTIFPDLRTPDTYPHFKWTDINPDKIYEFEIASDEAFDHKVVNTTLEDPVYDHIEGFSDQGSQDDVYYYRVRCKDKKGETSKWAVGSFELVTRPLPPLFIIRPPPRTNNPRPAFTWDPKSAAGSALFQLEISTDPGFKDPEVIYITETPEDFGHTLERDLPESGYFYRICSIDLNGKASVWNFDRKANYFNIDLSKPNAPVVEVPERTDNVPISISGSKKAGTGILLNGHTIMEPNEEEGFDVQAEIFYGVNVLVFHGVDKTGNLSNPVVRTCTFNPPMRQYDFYTRDSLSDNGVEPGEADYGSAPDTIVIGPMKDLKIDPDGPNDRSNFDSDLDLEIFTHYKEGTLRHLLKDPEKLFGMNKVSHNGENFIFVRTLNRGFMTGKCKFRLFYAPYSTWPKVGQWVEITPEHVAGGKRTRWHRFPEPIPGSDSEIIVSEPIVWTPDDLNFPPPGQHSCLITVIQGENIIEDPSFILDRSLDDSYISEILDSYPDVFRLGTYLSNNVSFKNINVISDIALGEVDPKNKRGFDEDLVPKDDVKAEKKNTPNLRPKLWNESIVISGPGKKTPNASIMVDISNFDPKADVWLRIPTDLLPPNRRFVVDGGSKVLPNSKMDDILRHRLFPRAHGYQIYKVNNEFRMEIKNLDFDIDQVSRVELFYRLSDQAAPGAQYTISLIQRFDGSEIGRALTILKTHRPEEFNYFVDLADGKLHKKGCKHLEDETRVMRPFPSAGEARLEGYRDCKDCF